MRISDWSSDVCSSDLPGSIENPDEGYRQRYSEEVAEPGYYRAKLESGVLAELTVTERCGVHRYHFAKGPGHILIDFAHEIEDDWDKGKGSVVEHASLTLADDGTLTGSRQVNRWARRSEEHTCEL